MLCFAHATMMEPLRELDLLGSCSHASDRPNTEQLRDRFAELDEFLSRSLPAKTTSGRTNDDGAIQSASPVSEQLALSISPPAEFPWRSVGEDQQERSIANSPKQDFQPNSSGHNTSSLNFRFRVSWGSKNSRYHALKPKRNPHHQKPPIRPIRVCKRSAATIRDEELLLKEEIAASGLLMLANQNPWKITKILTESDLNLQSRLLISKALVHEHIIPYLDEQSREKIHSKDGLIVSVRDCDTDDNEVFQLKLKWWNSSRSYNFQGGWIKNFVNRRHLDTGDQIGLFWSRIDNLFAFSVLQQAKLRVC